MILPSGNVSNPVSELYEWFYEPVNELESKLIERCVHLKITSYRCPTNMLRHTYFCPVFDQITNPEKCHSCHRKKLE